MKKYLALIALIVCAAVCFCGCNQEDKEDVENGAEPSPYSYHFGEVCANTAVFIQIKSFEISDSYGDTIATEEDDVGSGYYVILGVNTNLIEQDFTHPKNEVYMIFGDENGRDFKSDDLEFVLFDEENKELVYEIPYDERIDYDQLCGLKPSDDNERYYITSPAFVMQLMCFEGEALHIENVLYYGKQILIELAPG